MARMYPVLEFLQDDLGAFDHVAAGCPSPVFNANGSGPTSDLEVSIVMGTPNIWMVYKFMKGKSQL